MTSRVLSLALVACSTAKGVDIEVTPPAGTAEVELLVAPDPCSDAAGSACADGIAWPMLMTQPPGTIYSLDNDTRNVIPVTKDGETIRFKLEPGKPSKVDRLAVIAFDGAGSASAAKLLDDVTIPSTPQIWRVALEAITPIGSMLGPPVNGAPTELVQVWRPPVRSGGLEDPSKFASCYARQVWIPDQGMWNREFLAPTSDADCDNEQIECNPYWYDYGTVASASPCLVHSAVSTTTACVIGLSLCADGKSNSTSCTAPGAGAPTVCVPDALCACTDPGKLQSCVRTLISSSAQAMSPVTTAGCGPFPVNTNTPGPCTSNNENQMVLTLPLVGASHISIGYLALPFGMPLATDAGSFPVGTATFSFTADPANGVIQFTWEKGPPPLGTPDLVLDVVFTLRHVLVPLKLGFGSAMLGCPPEPITTQCQLTGNGSADSEFQCGN